MALNTPIANARDFDGKMAKRDLKYTFKMLWQGSYYQFKDETSWAILGTGTALTYASFNHDEKYLTQFSDPKPSGFVTLMGNHVSNLFNLPLFPMATYYLAQKFQNSKLKQFAMEFTAATYLGLLESGLLSAVSIHPRPSTDNLSVWEENFRFDSSFPSGHMIGITTLTYKLFQFYGPLYAVPAAFVTYLTMRERVGNKKHHFSDTVGSIFISLLASEGVRAASGTTKYNHSIYSKIFGHKKKHSKQNKSANQPQVFYPKPQEVLRPMLYFSRASIFAGVRYSY